MTTAIAQKQTLHLEDGRFGTRFVADDEDRLEFLPRHFAPSFMYFESQVYALASKVIKNYRGGLWQFAYTADGHPFVYPKGSSEREIQTVFGGPHITVPSEIAGLLVTGQAILILLQNPERHGLTDTQHDEFVDLYHELIKDGRAIAKANDLVDEYFQLTD